MCFKNNELHSIQEDVALKSVTQLKAAKVILVTIDTLNPWPLIKNNSLRSGYTNYPNNNNSIK